MYDQWDPTPGVVERISHYTMAEESREDPMAAARGIWFAFWLSVLCFWTPLAILIFWLVT